MANELGTERFIVQQTLHGYGEGHRLIIASVTMPSLEARTMLVLSDSSGGGVKLPPAGYLTGYPLTGLGKYVLARTWAAPEMARPGCVWTHSLIVDFSDLAQLMNAEDLLRLFRRPEGSAVSEYKEPLTVGLPSRTNPTSEVDADRAGGLIGALYGKPKQKVIDHYYETNDESLVLAIWMQQWPRLRRSFRFCTFSVGDRSTSSETFDLQLFASAQFTRRASSLDAVSALPARRDRDLDPLVRDLIVPDGGGLRTFLRDVGGDVTSGRVAMLPLTQLFSALDPDTPAHALAEAVEHLDRLGPSQARAGRIAFARIAMERADELDDRAFHFALDQVSSDERLLGMPAERVGQALFARDPAAFGDALRQGGTLGNAASAALHDIEAEELISGLAKTPSTAEFVVAARPDILGMARFWTLCGTDVDMVLNSAQVTPERAVGVVKAMMVAGRASAAETSVRRFGARSVIRALDESIGRVERERLSSWFQAAILRSSELAAALADGSIRQRSLLILLARSIDPDAVPNDFGDDPWLKAMEATGTSGDLTGEDHLAAFLLSRGLGWRSRSIGRLMSFCVQRVHQSLAADRLDYDTWRLVDRRLPWVSPWREWDRCGRVRRAVVDRFVGWELDPLEFGIVVDDVTLWRGLVDIAAETGRGRRYLERVRRRLKDEPNDGWWERAQIIDRVCR